MTSNVMKAPKAPPRAPKAPYSIIREALDRSVLSEISLSKASCDGGEIANTSQPDVQSSIALT